jgi:hypothetical protein
MRSTLFAFCAAILLAPFAQSQDASSEARKPRDDTELRIWLERMSWHHGYSTSEMQSVLELTKDEVAAALVKFDIRPQTKPKRAKDAQLLVMPYPGGRHPRIGFLDGAVNPQRETKLSVFAPWDESSYVVLDVPEACWSNLGLIYLAHTHVDTIWTKQKISLPRLEWRQRDDGAWIIERKLPNGIEFAVEAIPSRDHLAINYSMKNGTKETLSDLRVQMCAMLKGVKGFDAQTNDNKIFRDEFAACKNAGGDRWIIHAWQPIQRAWGNAPCPCLHADPKLPDCPPGESREAKGWLSFYEGKDLDAEFNRIRENWK